MEGQDVPPRGPTQCAASIAACCGKRSGLEVPKRRETTKHHHAKDKQNMPWLLLVLIAAVAICPWLSPPGSSLNRSAQQALDSTVALLCQASGDEDEDNDNRCRKLAKRVAARPLSAPGSFRGSGPELPGTGATRQNRTATRRKRITPFQAKRVAAKQRWRCAMCGELLQEDFEVDHIIPLHRGGSSDNNIESLQALHKRCHMVKNSLEQRGS